VSASIGVLNGRAADDISAVYSLYAAEPPEVRPWERAVPAETAVASGECPRRLGNTATSADWVS